MKTIHALKLIASFAFLLGLSACSTQYRDALPQISEDELVQMFGTISERANDSYVKALSSSTDVFGGGTTVMWHARDEKGRPAASVLSVEDMSIFNNGASNPSAWASSGTRSWQVLTQVDVIFVDSVDVNKQRVFSLLLSMVGVGDSGEMIESYYAVSSEPGSQKFTDDEFEVRVGDLTLVSRDLSDDFDDELAGSVKLDIYDANGDYVGQVSTMSGYGN